MPRKNSQNRSPGDELQASRLQDINEDIDDIYANWDDRLKVFLAISGTALKIDIGAWNYVVSAVLGAYAWWTDISVTNSATNYIMLDSYWTIQISTSAWNPVYARLAVVVCSWWVITSITDARYDVVWWSIISAINPYNTKTSKSNTTVYQASSTGWLLVVVWRWDSNPEVQVFSDWSNPPTTVVWWYASSWIAIFVYGTITVPILPNMYYKVTWARNIYYYDYQ